MTVTSVEFGHGWSPPKDTASQSTEIMSQIKLLSLAAPNVISDLNTFLCHKKFLHVYTNFPLLLHA